MKEALRTREPNRPEGFDGACVDSKEAQDLDANCSELRQTSPK